MKYNSICLIFLLFTFLGCERSLNPDDGLKFKSSLDEISVSQLKKYNYFELLKNSGAYVKHINDTIIVYEYEHGMFTRRHAMFKYFGDTTINSFTKIFAAKGFTMLKVINPVKNKLFLVEDNKYAKKYYVRFSDLKNLDFSFPDTIESN